MKILGFIIGAGMLLGLIGFIIMMIQFAWAAANGGVSGFLLWMPLLGVGSDRIKGKITFNGADVQNQEAENCDPMKQPLRVAHHSMPKKPMKKKPEWWRFLTEESFGSLLEKRHRKKAEDEARKCDPWQGFQ